MSSPVSLKLAGCANTSVTVESLDCTVLQLKEAIGNTLGTLLPPLV